MSKPQSKFTNVDGGWLVFRWDWGLLRIICNCLPFSLVFKLSIGIIPSLNLRLHKSLAKRSTHLSTSAFRFLGNDFSQSQGKPRNVVTD